MNNQYIEIETKGRLTYITLNRPEKRNALNSTLVNELTEAMSDADNDPVCKVIILRAKGEAFCAGADLIYLKSLQNFTYKENLSDSRTLMELLFMIHNLRKIVIAQIQGHAIAGGCGIASICDYSFTVPEAKFGYPEVKIGFIPAIVMVFLIRKMGEGKASELLLSGDLVSAQYAREIGLVNFVVPVEELEITVHDFGLRLCEQNSSQSISTIKEMISEIHHLSFREALEYAAEKNAIARESEDFRKGIAAFLNKEKMKW